MWCVFWFEDSTGVKYVQVCGPRVETDYVVRNADSPEQMARPRVYTRACVCGCMCGWRLTREKLFVF